MSEQTEQTPGASTDNLEAELAHLDPDKVDFPGLTAASSDSRRLSQLMRRVVRLAIGVPVTIIGIIMMPLPGPGIPVVAVGLGIMAPAFPWADRQLQRVRDRLPRDADGSVSKWVYVLPVVGVVVGVVSLVVAWRNGLRPDDLLFWLD